MQVKEQWLIDHAASCNIRINRIWGCDVLCQGRDAGSAECTRVWLDGEGGSMYDLSLTRFTWRILRLKSPPLTPITQVESTAPAGVSHSEFYLAAIQTDPPTVFICFTTTTPSSSSSSLPHLHLSFTSPSSLHPPFQHHSTIIFLFLNAQDACIPSIQHHTHTWGRANRGQLSGKFLRGNATVSLPSLWAQPTVSSLFVLLLSPSSTLMPG